MKIHVSFDLDDVARRRVRAGLKRGGKATRADIRVWAGRVVADALDRLPEVKPRRVKAPPPVPPAPIVDGAVCARCRRPVEDHGKMLKSCPPVSGVPKGGRFAA